MRPRRLRPPAAEPLESIRADLKWSGRQDSDLRHSAPKTMTRPYQHGPQELVQNSDDAREIERGIAPALDGPVDEGGTLPHVPAQFTRLTLRVRRARERSGVSN